MDAHTGKREASTILPTRGLKGAADGSSTFAPGDVLAGRFRVIRFIARGGMGEVYEAEDLELLERVALKTIRPDVAHDERTTKRLLREVNLARKVTHPNVCRIFDVFYHQIGGEGASPERRVAIVSMELLPGETLAQWLGYAGPLHERDAQPIVSQMAAGLTAAHDAGIVHRDFKSNNVILVPSADKDGAYRAVVTDFGLARLRVDGDSSAASVTLAGEVHGTPSYMAPEQVEGKDVTPATDVYALGVVMYEMVTGTLPFVGDTPLSIAAKRLSEAPRSPRTHAPNLSPVWESAILRCLARDPRERFTRPADVAKALDGNAPVAPATHVETTAPAHPGRWRRPALAFGVAAVALAVLGGYVQWRATQTPGAPASDTVTDAAPAAPQRRAVAVLGFRNLSGRTEAAWLSTAFAEMLTTELGAGEQLRTIPGESVARVRQDLGLDAAESYGTDTLERLRATLGTDLVVLGSYLALPGGQVRLDLRLQDAAAGETVASFSDTASEAELIELMSRTGARLRERLGVTELSADQTAGVRAALPSSSEAARLYAEGLLKLRMFDALSARGLLEKAVAADPRNALAHSALSAAWSALGYDGKAVEQAKAAVDSSASLSREQRLSVEGRYAEATREWDRAVQAYTTLWNFFPDNVDYGLQLAAAQLAGGTAQESLATVVELRKLPPPASGDLRIDIAEADAAAALSDFKRQQTAAARAAERAVPQGARLLLARARLTEGDALQNLGEPQKAMAAFQEAGRIYTELGDRGGTARSLSRVAVGWRRQGDLTRAKAMYEQSLATFREIGDERSTVLVTGNLANVLRQLGELDASNRRYRESLAAARRIGDRRGEAQALHSSAIVYRQQGDSRTAKALYGQALVIRRQLGARSGIATTLNNLGNVLYDEDDLAGARKMYEESLAISREIADKNGIALALGNIAGVDADQGNLPSATKIYGEALVLWRELGNRSFIANGLSATAQVLGDQGELTKAQASAEEALALYRELGETRGVANVEFRLGEVKAAQGNLAEARTLYEDSLKLREQLEEKGTAAQSRAALAQLLLHEGNARAAESLARQVAAAFREQRAPDDEAAAMALVAHALVAQGKAGDARDPIRRASSQAQRSQNRLVRFAVAIAQARVDAAAGRAASAISSLESVASEAAKLSFAAYELDARLALGEIEMRSGNAAAGRTRLLALERDARARGFGLIARHAAAELKK